MFILRHHNTFTVTWFLKKLIFWEVVLSRSSSSICYNNFSLGEHWGTQHNSLLDNSYLSNLQIFGKPYSNSQKDFHTFFLITENSALKNIHDDKPLSLQTA